MNLIKNNTGSLGFVSLGPNDQYFVRNQKGRTWWQMTAHISDDLNKTVRRGGEIKSVLFGEDENTCFVRGNWTG